MYLIGLTGPSGAGKSLFSDALRPYGIDSIDTDRVYHSLLIPPSPCLDGIVSEFGEGVLNPDGSLCRPRLASLVFSEGSEEERAEKLARLNAVTHRYVIEETKRILKEMEERGDKVAADTVAVIDAPALFEANMDAMCNLTVAILAPKELRIERIMARDGLTRERATARIEGQHDDGFYTSRADVVFQNGDSPDLLKSEIIAYMKTRLPDRF